MALHADIIVPAFSDDIDDVQITNWLRSEGEDPAMLARTWLKRLEI